MDADCQESRRDSYLSQREKRWSMNSQRLEEIVAELMKPISDVRRSFDTDLSALLEEYLTEAGLHALEAGEDTEGAAPNFTELALLLQHSASVYGRKVDFLYQHVLTVSDSLQASTAEVTGAGSEEPATPSGKRRRRASAGESGEFAPLSLTASAAARREPGVARPPPTLPRIYVELEPRQMTECDAPLLDYEREPIGLLADFQVTWRLQDGLLVDELEGGVGLGGAALRAIPLVELQAALDAAAPPDPPPPVHCSTPLASRDGTPAPTAPTASTDTPTEMLLSRKKERKRKCDSNYELVRSVKMLVSKELRRKLSKRREFSVAEEWITCVVEARKRRVLAVRRARDRAGHADFRGFDCTDSVDIGGFPGWSPAECCAAGGVRAALRLDDSDDDGFFEQSSLGESDGSRVDDSQLSAHTTALSHTSCESAEAASSAAWAEWQRAVVERAAAGEARGLDVRRLADRVLDQLPDDRENARARPFRDVVLGARADRPDVSGLFLATLFLANAGNVRLVGARPLHVDSFAVQLVSRDRRRLLAAVDVHDREEGATPPPPPPPR